MISAEWSLVGSRSLSNMLVKAVGLFFLNIIRQYVMKSKFETITYFILVPNNSKTTLSDKDTDSKIGYDQSLHL